MQVRLDCYKNMQILIVKFMILSCKIESNQNDICYDNDSVFLLYSHYFHCYCIFSLTLLLSSSLSLWMLNVSVVILVSVMMSVVIIIIITSLLLLLLPLLLLPVMICFFYDDHHTCQWYQENGLVNLVPYSKRMFNCHFIDETSPNVLLGRIDAACNS